MLNDGMFSSNSAEWETPQYVYDYLDSIHHFTLDACASSSNFKNPNYFSIQNNALRQDWIGKVFMNPPYGRYVGDWVQKAYQEAHTNSDIVVCLLPCRTDTKWWHRFCMSSYYVFLLEGRLKFSGYGAAPFPSSVVIFKKGFNDPIFKSLRIPKC